MMRNILAAVSAIRQGGIIAYPTEGVWGLGCDPFQESAVEKLLALKSREREKGLILVASSLQQLGPLYEGLPKEYKLVLEEKCPGPNTWLLPDPDQIIPVWIKGSFATVAVRVSAHPLVSALCTSFGGMLVSTSANPAGKDPALSKKEVEQYFSGELDFIVPGDLGGQHGPSKIIDLFSNRVLRS